MDRKMPRYCGTSGNLPRRTVSSDSNFFRVTFHSNHVYDSTGFAANYQFRTVDDGTETIKFLPLGLYSAHMIAGSIAE